MWKIWFRDFEEVVQGHSLQMSDPSLEPPWVMIPCSVPFFFFFWKDEYTGHRNTAGSRDDNLKYCSNHSNVIWEFGNLVQKGLRRISECPPRPTLSERCGAFSGHSSLGCTVLPYFFGFLYLSSLLQTKGALLHWLTYFSMTAESLKKIYSTRVWFFLLGSLSHIELCLTFIPPSAAVYYISPNPHLFLRHFYLKCPVSLACRRVCIPLVSELWGISPLKSSAPWLVGS